MPRCTPSQNGECSGISSSKRLGFLIVFPATHLCTVDGRTVTMLLSLNAIKNQTIREVVMATAGIVVCSPYGMTCTECNELIVAPKSSTHVSSHEVRHFWSCDHCGHEIEMA